MRAALLGGTVLAGLLAPVAALPADADSGVPSGAAAARESSALYLVTLRDGADAAGIVAALDLPTPMYRWSTALNGFAVRLDPEQVAAVDARPEVDTVEPDEVRPLAAAAPMADARRAGHLGSGNTRGGAGVVVGLIDSGLATANPLFAQRSLAGPPASFTGACETASDWVAAECNGKVVGARWYVDGFGADRLRATSALSPRDTDGHGTEGASVAVGNSEIPVRIGEERLGRFGGMAPDAALAIYKACWSAPDPDDDGCSTADVVTAIDDATRDGVDVLSLSLGGPATIDTVDRALLGATEAGVVVVAAAGNDPRAAAAHPAPWITTVGGSTGATRRGQVLLRGEDPLDGAMLSGSAVGPARVVRAADVAAPGATRATARFCVPGSLDATRVKRAIVVCERGHVGRIDKSRAVSLSDGTGMILLNRRPASVDADVHSVPTVHLPVRNARVLDEWLEAHPRGRVTLRPQGLTHRPARVADFSSAGARGMVKPDVVAPATGVLAAVPGSPGWTVTSGTSIATAHTAGVAAVLLAEGRSPELVRSALVTTAWPVEGNRGGAGLVRPAAAHGASLAVTVEPADYRGWLEGRRTHLNTPTVSVSPDTRRVRRTITNVSGRRLYFSSTTDGLGRHVSVRPAAVRLGPGESASFTIRIDARGGRAASNSGYVVWRGADHSVTRLPLTLTR